MKNMSFHSPNRFHPSTAPVLLSLLAGTLSLSAVELGDLAGDWTLAEFESPSRLRETFYNFVTDTIRTGTNSLASPTTNEVLIDAAYPDPLLTRTRTFSISAGGAVTGGETGQVLGISDNRIIYSDGTEPSTVFSNTTGDLLLTSSRDADQQDQTLCLKRPTDLSQADFSGNWTIVNMINPDNLSTIIDFGRLSDVFFAGESLLATGPITMDGAGNFSGIFSGTISGTANGDVTVTTGGGSIPFKTNASKNVATATPGDNDEQEYIVLVRKPATLTTADLAGTWRISAHRIPTTLTEEFFNTVTLGTRQADSAGMAQADEILSDLVHPDRASLQRMRIAVTSGGSVSGTISGSLTANGDKSATLTVDGQPITLHPNADKTFMVGGVTDPESHELILCIKTSDDIDASDGQATDLRTIFANGKVVLSWNGTSNLQLEESTALSGWTAIDGTTGGNSHVTDPANDGSKFFRLTETP